MEDLWLTEDNGNTSSVLYIWFSEQLGREDKTSIIMATLQMMKVGPKEME